VNLAGKSHSLSPGSHPFDRKSGVSIPGAKKRLTGANRGQIRRIKKA